jgi:2-C-methyl-D-erythritol 2,4-cyclodiphosphate synthase
VEIAFERGLLGHSDADVLLHAIADALLGAAGLGDIGRHFPDDDERYAGADSRVLLRETAGSIARAGFGVVNVDATLIARAPRLAPYAEQMAGNIASDLGLNPGCVSVKAKTTERLGFTGRGEGIAAFAVVLLVRARPA